MKDKVVQMGIKEKLKQWKIELKKLEENKNHCTSMPKNRCNDLEYIKATEELKRRIELKGLIRRSLGELHKSCTDTFVEDLKNSSNIPEFSWGINEKEESKREVIFEGASNGEYIRAMNYGSFEYLTGKSGISIENIPDNNHVTIDIEHFITYDDKIKILPTDIETAITQHPEYLAERLNLLRITRGIGENQRDYFILSPIQKHQLQDEQIRDVFINEYCSDIYLNSIVTGKNGIYAGNIIIGKDGFCEIGYEKSSVRAAKLAETIPGTTQLHLNMLKGEIRKLPGRIENFEDIRGRFLVEIKEGKSQKDVERND